MIPEKFKVEHLVLLVGTNPLPNYVAAKLLLKDGGTLHLLYSDDTYPIAKRLHEHLESQVYLEPVNPTNAEDIARKTRKQLRGITGTVGLHYTGGTKAMAVHAYRAIEQAWQEEDAKPVFSYLDAGTFKMRFDPDWSEEVLFAVKPKLKDLAALHGARLRKNSPQREAGLWGVATATALAQSIAQHGMGPWQTWLQTLADQLTGAAPEAVALPRDSRLAGVVAALRQDLLLGSKATVILPDAVLKLKPRSKWLGGEWLEHYVLAQLLSIADDAQVHDYGMSLETKQGGKSDFDFEFDVAAMRGYQFFGISCTTSTSKDKAKQKLFEAYIRARQLGGDEARVGLVCAYEDAYRFEKEVVQEWLAKGKIKIFGPREWPDLAEHLRDWLKTVA